MPAADALTVYDAVAAAGDHPAGRAQDAGQLRMEKAYRDFGHDIDNTDNVLEVGLGFAVDLDKPSFIGRDAVRPRQGRRRPAPPAGAGPADRPRAVALPRRAGAARRRGRSATSAPRRTAGPSAAPSASPCSTPASRSPPTGSRPARGPSTSPVRRTPPRCRCGRCTTRRTSASKRETRWSRRDASRRADPATGQRFAHQVSMTGAGAPSSTSGARHYFGGIRMPPSTRIVSPFM